MKTVIIETPHNVLIKDIPEPVLTKGNAIVRVSSVGICGSDVTALKGVNPTVKYPLIIGHEISGTIDSIDEAADSSLKKGDRVVVEPYIHCGECYSCQRGIYNNCQNLQVLGGHIDGGMSEYVMIPTSYLHKIPDGMTFQEAAVVEPLTISLHGVTRSSVGEKDYVVITGAGAIGLLAALSVKAYGGIPVLMDISDDRLKFARDLGIDHTLNVTDPDHIKKLTEITEGRLADKMIECSGSESAIKNIIHYVAHSGTVSFVGWPKKDIELPIIRFMQKELNIHGSRCSLNQFPEAIRLIETGKVDVKKIISKVVPLADVPYMLKELSENPGNYIKVVVDFP